jgi:hypothetical protein
VSDLNFILEEKEVPEGISALPQKSLIDTLLTEADKFNAQLPEARKVPTTTVKAIISREKTHPNAMRALGQYFNTIEDPYTNTPTAHKDLLPRNHPLSNKWISQLATRAEISRYFESDTTVEDHETRALVASALSHEPDSAQRFFYNEVLLAKTNNLSLIALIDKTDKIIEDRKASK